MKTRPKSSGNAAMAKAVIKSGTPQVVIRAGKLLPLRRTGLAASSAANRVVSRARALQPAVLRGKFLA